MKKQYKSSNGPQDAAARLQPCLIIRQGLKEFIYYQFRFIDLEAETENISAKLDDVIRKLDHVETLLLMGEVFPDTEEIKAIKSYLSRAGREETEFIPFEEIDNEL